MVLPPNRIGGTRGPNGATLDDVVAGLVAVRDEVTSVRLALGPALELITTGIAIQNATLETMLTRMTYLTGSVAPSSTNFGSSGLPGYLSFVLGSRQEVNEVGGSLFNLANIVNINLSFLTSRMVGLSLGGSLPPSEDTAPFWVLQAIAELIGVGGTGGVDSNLFALLRSIDTNTLRSADCCENGPPEPPPGEGENPLPELVCPETDGFSLGVRNTGWNIRELNIAGLDEWVATWPFLGNANNLIDDVNPLFNNPGIRNEGTQTRTYCFKWNYLSGQIPAQLGILYQPPGEEWGIGDGSFTIPGPNYPIGNTVEEMVQGATIAIFARTVAGSGPPTNNVWFSFATPA